MKRRRMIRPVALLIKPVQAVGIEANRRTNVKRIRGPTVSQRGPSRNRTITVPATFAILDCQISPLVRPRVSLISESRGVMANQTKNATKKANLKYTIGKIKPAKVQQKENNMIDLNSYHEQWKALIWGRAKEQRLISFALSSWSGSTSRSYLE